MSKYTISEFRADLDQPYAWPGGYPRYFVTRDGAALSYAAARENAALIEASITNQSNDGWEVIDTDINWENTDLYCDHTGQKIECAYGD